MRKLPFTLTLLSSLLTVNAATAAAPKASGTDEKQVWITIGADAVQTIQKQYSTAVPMQYLDTVATQEDAVAVVSVPESSLNNLSEIMHEEFNRCGGYFYHESREEALSYANSIQTIQPIAVNYSINNPEGVQALTSQLDADKLSETVDKLSSYRNRYYTRQSGVDSAIWIKDNWTAISAGRSDISVELYEHGSWAQPSVIATVTGSTHPNEIVIVGGHLDSINGSSPSYGSAPGADDNASGIAVVTETLRSIVQSGYKPARTVMFMGYAAEEVGLRGSNSIAQSFKSNNKNVLGVAQFDMTGVQGTPDLDIVFMTDYTSSAQNQFMATLIDTYLSDLHYGYSRCGYGCSDHASWYNQGYPASIPFESTFNDSNHKIHTSQDTEFDQEHALKFARLSAAFVAELAKSESNPPDEETDPEPDDNALENGVAKTGLSADSGDKLTYTFDVPSDATNISITINGGSGDADLYVKLGSEPGNFSYDCRPYKNGNNETCNMNGGGKYYINIKAYSSFSGVTLTGSYSN